jgi:hypothetical protein
MPKIYVDMVHADVEIDGTACLFSDLGLIEDDSKGLLLSNQQIIKQRLELKYPDSEIIFHEPLAQGNQPNTY